MQNEINAEEIANLLGCVFEKMYGKSTEKASIFSGGNVGTAIAGYLIAESISKIADAINEVIATNNAVDNDIKNAKALLNEVIINGTIGSEHLYSWFCSNQILIEETQNNLAEKTK
jgi:hypothetical protein